ncbi:MAG: hypothetical protein SFV52_01645 [Saprospiraceae bacterium]|nr:hypothetical protein [Saprospiraceae bacterium]
MKALKDFFYNTLIGGLFFLVPLFVLVMVAQKIWLFFQNFGSNLAKYLGLDGLMGVASKSIMAALLILILCFSFGLLARWSYAKAMRDWFERRLTSVFPQYEYYKTLVEQKLKLSEAPARAVVLVRRPGGWQPGIVVETFEDGKKVIFFPLSPKTTDGNVLLVAPEDMMDSSLNEKTLNAVLNSQGKGLLG